ncbi:RNA polymerase factor sigma-54 [Asaia krungthepensis]|uniref:RNA polymerase sigma-54 factor n=1 Tax=Asaia krungthepensis NRIC 0535 TaxID=1307925 RepID=A0ABQ0Q5U2_9PROT|nr:RNA polymerase factor sigma-54 [Asaia krungthepensis]GBQ92795.1 RNA polymerase sigma-54 factor RpoN [Asaia krungthepensis NRIC 0535]
MARLTLQPRQTTGLVMTAELQQAIGLLQLSNQELLTELTLAAEANPLLIVSAPGADEPGYEERPCTALDERSVDLPPDLDPDTAPPDLSRWEDDPLLRHGALDSEDRTGLEPRAAEPSVLDHILAQIRRCFPFPREQAIALALLDALDENGRLDTPPQTLAAELGCTPGEIEAMREQMLLFDPPGCFALTLAECLAAQFRAENRYDPSVACLLNHLDWLARGEHERLRKACGLDENDYADLLRELRTLDPRPGAALAQARLDAAIHDPDSFHEAAPDLIIALEDHNPVISLNPATWPRLEIDDALYRKLLRGRETDHEYAREKQGEARTLLRAVEQRARSLLLICEAVARHQFHFLIEGITALRPLTLAQIASATGLHESTVSRVTATRLVETPHGVLPLRRFFSTALGEEAEETSADAIKARIRQILNAENPDAILSDDAVTATLQADGIAIQRRTVAKYREALGIAGSAQRRRDYRMKATLAARG